MKLKVILKRSAAGCPKRQRETLKGLGLGRLQSERVLEDSPSIRGMVAKVAHLVECTQVEG